MAILYFLGGEDIRRRDSREINSKAFSRAGGTPVILYFPWTATTTDKYREIIGEYFSDLGASRIH